MDYAKEYFTQWNESADYFYNNNTYQWMSNFVSNFNVILEVGCGSGHSTLALLKNKSKVIAIDKNPYCIEATEKLLLSNGYRVGRNGDSIIDIDAIVIQTDILDMDYRSIKYPFDLVLVWNIGTYRDTQKTPFYVRKLLEYGLTEDQIVSDFASSYSELMLWKSCNIAKLNNTPIHIIERRSKPISQEDGIYYNMLKEQIGFNRTEFNELLTKSKSNSGKVLKIDDKPISEDIVDVYLLSILFS